MLDGGRWHAHQDRQPLRPHSLSLSLDVDINDEQYACNASPQAPTEPDHGGAYCGEMIKQQHAASLVGGVPEFGSSCSPRYRLGVHFGIGGLHGACNVLQAGSVLSDATRSARAGKTSMQLRYEGGLTTTARTVEDQVLTVPHAFEQIRAQFANTTVHAHLRSWLAEGGVPDAEADVFMGHEAEGSATGKRYIHRRPEYLRSVTDGIESLYAALAVLVKRAFKGRELVDQPLPDFASEGSVLAKF